MLLEFDTVRRYGGQTYPVLPVLSETAGKSRSGRLQSPPMATARNPCVGVQSDWPPRSSRTLSVSSGANQTSTFVGLVILAASPRSASSRLVATAGRLSEA